MRANGRAVKQSERGWACRPPPLPLESELPSSDLPLFRPPSLPSPAPSFLHVAPPGVMIASFLVCVTNIYEHPAHSSVYWGHKDGRHVRPVRQRDWCHMGTASLGVGVLAGGDEPSC